MKKLSYSFLKSLVLSSLSLFIAGCSLTKVPYTDPRCKIQAHIDQSFIDYLSQRFQKGSTPRIAILPFDVPANFSPSNSFNPDLNYGNKITDFFKQRILSKGEKIIVEVFDRSNWPGKKMDFVTGDFIAMKQARDAGYDFIVTGYLDNIIDAQVLTIHSKIIDTENSTTVWYGTSNSVSPEQPTKNLLNFLSRGIYPYRDDVMHLNQRVDGLVACTVERIFADHATGTK